MKLLTNSDIFGLPSFALSISSLLLFLQFTSFNKYVKVFQTFAEMSLTIYMLHVSQPHMQICWKVLQQYKNNSKLFIKYAIIYTLKIYTTNGIISLIISKFNNLLIFKRNLFCKLIDFTY